MAAIADYKDILAHRERINQIIYDELMEIQKRFGMNGGPSFKLVILPILKMKT